MSYLPGLSLLERLALWVLVRSSRTSLVVVKERLWPTVFTAANLNDPVAAYVTNNETEPPSMQLERLYHLPAHGEEE